MSITVLQQGYRVARKDHNCMACDWFYNGFDWLSHLSFSDRRAIAKAKRIADKNNGMIKKGERYAYQNIKGCDGELYTFRAIPEVLEICQKHDLFSDGDSC